MKKISAIVLLSFLLGSISGYASGPTNIEKAIRFYAKGNYEKAMLAFAKSSKREIDVQGYIIWGLSAYRLGKFHSALLKFKQAHLKNRSNGDILGFIGETHLKLGQPMKALKVLRKTKDLKTTNPVALLILWSSAASMSGNYQEAIHVIKKVLKKQPQNATALGISGEILLKTGQYKEAVIALQKAIGYDPGSFLHHYNMACAMSLLGRPEASCDSLSKAVKLGFSDIDKALVDTDLAVARKSGCFKKAITNPKP